MYSSCFQFKCLVFIPIFVIQFFLILNVSSTSNLTNEYLNHKCLTNQGKYERGSGYEKNLNGLFQQISTQSKFKDGLAHTTLEDPSVTIIFHCRGDSYGSFCRSCAATAVAGFRKRCPRNKGGTIWYEQCFLDVNMVNDRTPRKTNYENIFSMHNPKTVSGDKKAFMDNMMIFLNWLIPKSNVPDVTGLNLYSHGEKKLGTNKVYAMLQCAPDILDCQSCLKWSIKELSKCCADKVGARVLGTTCNLRYELYPFLRTNLKTV